MLLLKKCFQVHTYYHSQPALMRHSPNINEKTMNKKFLVNKKLCGEGQGVGAGENRGKKGRVRVRVELIRM